MGDLDRLRARLAAGPAPGPGSTSGGSPGFLGKVTSAGANLGVGKFFLATPTTVMGAEVDAAAGLLADAVGSIAVYALGPGTPATGDYLACRWVDYRWVAEKAAGAGAPVDTVTVQNCFCPVPKTLRMTSADEACNYRMFQSCTIQYGPAPAWMAPMNITGNQWISTEMFLDPIAAASFVYLLFCQYNQFFLQRLYPTSPYGSPFRDGTLYTWLVGGYGNVCSPFHLHNGAPFPGSDATCSVTIDPA